jgi:hypothetical protein
LAYNQHSMKLFLFLSAFVIFGFLLPTKVYAQPVPPAAAAPCNNTGESGLKLTDCYKLNETQSVGSVFNEPAVLINLAVRIIFLLSGIILFVMIIYAGFLTISGGTKGQEQARQVVTSAVIGLIIVFSAYWIMQIIKLVTGTDIGF